MIARREADHGSFIPSPHCIHIDRTTRCDRHCLGLDARWQRAGAIGNWAWCLRHRRCRGGRSTCSCDAVAGHGNRRCFHAGAYSGGCAANFECRTEHTYDGGDHVIFVGRVIRMRHDPAIKPLLFHQGRYRSLESPL